MHWRLVQSSLHRSCPNITATVSRQCEVRCQAVLAPEHTQPRLGFALMQGGINGGVVLKRATWKRPRRKKRREPPPAATVLMSSCGA